VSGLGRKRKSLIWGEFMLPMEHQKKNSSQQMRVGPGVQEKDRTRWQ
jgi:hypothetical protein